jgi:biopolymer transport protein ExbB/TolQ
MLQEIQKLGVGFLAGGIWMWAILACQVFSFAIIAERIITLYLKRKPNQMTKVQPFEKTIKAGNLENLINQSRDIKSTDPIGQVALVGAQSALNFGGKEEIQLKMDEVLVETSQRLDKNTAFLGTIANVSTLLGLLGTIIGMIDAFSSLSAAAASERATLLAQGISMAMYTTAYGLIVAIPALAAYAVLQNRSQQLMEDLNKAAMKLYIWLTYSFESVQTGKTKPANKA